MTSAEKILLPGTFKINNHEWKQLPELTEKIPKMYK